MTNPADHLRLLKDVLEANTESFTEFARIGGLDPATDFRRADLHDVDFGSDDLTAFDFTRANLRGANLSNARGLSLSRLDTVSFNSDTQWPHYLNYPCLVAAPADGEFEAVSAPHRRSYGFQRRGAAPPETQTHLRWDEKHYWDLHDKAKYDDALKYCRSVLAANPNNAEARASECHLLDAHLQKSNEAANILRASIVSSPAEINYHFRLAQSLESMRLLDEAETEFRKLPILAKGSVQRSKAAKVLAEFIVRINSWNDQSSLDEVRRLLNFSVKTALRKGELQLAKDSSEALLKAGLTLSPTESQRSAVVMAKLDKWEQAIEHTAAMLRKITIRQLRDETKGWVQPLQILVIKGKARKLADALATPEMAPKLVVLRHALLTMAGISESVKLTPEQREDSELLQKAFTVS
jgi:tetratricopeptide (TPR) repeat protein